MCAVLINHVTNLELESLEYFHYEQHNCNHVMSDGPVNQIPGKIFEAHKPSKWSRYVQGDSQMGYSWSRTLKCEPNMREMLKVGNKISCLIEEALPNHILVSLKTSKTVFRGVLINEQCSIVKRWVFKWPSSWLNHNKYRRINIF